MPKATRLTVNRARQSRRQLSVPETILWVRLRARPAGFKFRRQHPAGPYILDFYCAQAKLAIEVDGISHDMGSNPDRDMERDQWLDAQHITVLRIAAAEIVRSVDTVVEQIVITAKSRLPLHRSSSGPPPRPGEETVTLSSPSLHGGGESDAESNLMTLKTRA